MDENLSPRFAEERDPDVAEYRRLSGAAVGALALGLLSPVALVDRVAWCVPVAGILVGGYAIWQIWRNAPTLSGRKMAIWGLWLSFCFAAAAPADWLFCRYLIRQEAKQYAGLWFDLLASGRPESAYQLSASLKDRQPLDDRLWEYYRNNPAEWRKLDSYVAPAKEGEEPRPIRTLLALGKSATARYLDTLQQFDDAGAEVLHLRYAVTFDDAGMKKTFFLVVQLVRLSSEDGRAVWRINGVNPEKKTG
jgi:hypothetical protein